MTLGVLSCSLPEKNPQTLDPVKPGLVTQNLLEDAGVASKVSRDSNSTAILKS